MTASAPRSGARPAGLILVCAAVLTACGAVRAAEGDAASEASRQIDALLEREWKEGKFPSVAAGVVRRDGLVHAGAFGLADRKWMRKATPETLYRIGSVTKVLTATLLAVLRDEGVVRLDDEVAAHLPPSVRLPADPRGAPAITLRHLATHTSGLPRIPVNLKPRGLDVYGGYTLEDLKEGLPRTLLDRPVGAGYGYSNLGFGLLGYALERAAGEPYGALLEKKVLGPLGMSRTSLEGRPGDLATGYDAHDPEKEAVPWDLGCLAPGGGLFSSVADLGRFMALQLRAGEGGMGGLDAGTLRELHEPQRLAGGWDLAVGLGWHVSPRGAEGNSVWHTGCVAGFHAYVGFAPDRGVGVIFLANATSDTCGAGPRLLDAAVRAYGVAPPKVEADPALRKAAEAVGQHFVADPPGSLESLFHETFLAEVPLPGVRRLFQDVHKACGQPEGHEVVPGKTSRIAQVIYRFPGGREARCDVEIEGAGKIIYFYVKLGGS